MEIIDLGAAAEHDVRAFGSARASHVHAVSIVGDGAVGIMRIRGGGHLGRHPAVVDQLFCVVEGNGWVLGADGHRVEIAAGEAALWPAGEEHESGSDAGMTAVVVEASRLIPRT